MDAADTAARARGAGLLLAHCAALGAAEEREQPFLRLEALIGRDLARLLVFALGGAHSRRR